jgi:hypothetical protein
MADRLRRRFYVETVIGGVAGVLGVLTVFWRDWIEALTGFDPDNHDGSVEWLIVAGLLVVAVVLGALARVEWRRALAVSP